jgi:hypothetical protein
MRRVVALSLWGSGSIFRHGTLRNCELYPKTLVGWQVWVFCPSHYDPELVYQIRARGARVVFVDPGDRLGMFWRYFAADYPDIHQVIFRDADSRPSEREARLINDWTESGKRFHIIRDHPAHFNPIMGGMWGCMGNSNLHFTSRVKRLISLASTPTGLSAYGFDQRYLASQIYPSVRGEAYVHDEFFENTGNLPVRSGLEYIGQRFDEKDQPDTSHDRELAAWETLKCQTHLFNILRSRMPYHGWNA